MSPTRSAQHKYGDTRVTTHTVAQRLLQTCRLRVCIGTLSLLSSSGRRTVLGVTVVAACLRARSLSQSPTGFWLLALTWPRHSWRWSSRQTVCGGTAVGDTTVADLAPLSDGSFTAGVTGGRWFVFFCGPSMYCFCVQAARHTRECRRVYVVSCMRVMPLFVDGGGGASLGRR